ncbi:MAG: GatB/YqeY domain-containing protein [bacterium]|nr:GatB/YqeY domain-containing protein [bacterium]
MTTDQLEADLKIALKKKDELALSALRNLKAEVEKAAITKGDKLSEEEVMKVLAKKVKQHKDSIDQFREGERNDLVELEEKQMEVLQKYLPQELSEQEVEDLVKKVISELNATASDFGKVMKEVLVQGSGRTDGSVVSKIVKQQLE